MQILQMKKCKSRTALLCDRRVCIKSSLKEGYDTIKTYQNAGVHLHIKLKEDQLDQHEIISLTVSSLTVSRTLNTFVETACLILCISY